MDKKFSIRQFPSPEHPYIVFPQKNLAVLDISRFTFCKVDYAVELGISLTIAESFDDRSGGDFAVAASAISSLAGRTAPSGGLGDVVVTFSSGSRARMCSVCRLHTRPSVRPTVKLTGPRQCCKTPGSHFGAAAAKFIAKTVSPT